jgi:glycosyltransferase involved in cell wall biosynthesis
VKIAVDIREIQSYPTGIGRYFEGLLNGLVSIKASHDFTLIANPGNPLFRKQWPENWKLHTVESAPKTVRQHLRLPHELRTIECDLMITNPFGYSVFGKHPYALIILDMINRHYPNLVSYKARLYERFLAKPAAAGASLILTISHFSQDDIHRYLEVEKEKVAVTHLAANPIFAAHQPQDKKIELLQRFGISREFFLYVGNRRPHKNLKILLQVYAQLKDEWNTSNTLPLVVISGDADRPMTSRFDYDVFTLMRNLRVEENVIVTGCVADDELACLYQEALFLVHPAQIEGFGLTPLEAMQSGCPVVASNRASIPEVVAEAGILLDPLDVQSWKNTIENLILDKEERSQMKEKGLKRAQQFSWEKTARETLRVIEGVL